MITTLVITSLVGGKCLSNHRSKMNENMRTVMAILLNLTTSVVIIFLNKWLYLNMKFPSMLLTLLHFITTFLCLKTFHVAGLFSIKHIPIKTVFPLSLSFCGFVVLTNLSLQYNTVGTFQVAKVLTTPCVLLLQWRFYGKTTPGIVIATIVPIVVGVFLSFYYDIKFNVTGLIFATSGVVVTSVYQVLVGQKQSELEINYMQLLYYQAPLSAILLFFPVILLEPVEEVFRHSWTFLESVALLASCLTAFGVNLSIYWIIGNTSALTYNMVGHLKFCLTVVGGFLLFSDPVSLNQLGGIGLALLGVLSYTHLKMKADDEKRRKNAKMVQHC